MDKSKVYDAVGGVVGSGFLLFNLINSVRQRKAREHVLYVSQMRKQMYLDSMKRLADAILMPHALSFLRRRVAKKLDLSTKEDMETLKFMSFTRMVLSAWAMTMVNLYIRVQIKVVWRNLYRDDKPLDMEINATNIRQYWATSDFLILSLPSLIRDMKAATTKVLERKQLADLIDRTELLHMIKDIMKTFAPAANPHCWLKYVVIENVNFIDFFKFMKVKCTDISIFHRLMEETREVLLSDEFASVLDILLSKIAEAITTELMPQETNDGFSGVPLHELVEKVSEIGLTLLDEYYENKFAHLIRNGCEAEVVD